MIEAEQLIKRYGRVLAVDRMSFSLERGRVIGVLGPNGAGKTTTLRMLIGFLPPTSGTARVSGIDVVRDPLAVRRCVGYLPESTPLYGEMRVSEYLRFRADLSGLERGRRRAAIDAALERCALREVARRPVRHLSKGYRQRVGLAAAIVHEPALLVLDEPTVGLDPAQIRDFRSLVRSLAGDRTVLYSTHILAEAERACDDVLMIQRGRLAAQGSVRDLLRGGAVRYRVVTDLHGADRHLAALRGVRSAALTAHPARESQSDAPPDARSQAPDHAAAEAGATFRTVEVECDAAHDEATDVLAARIVESIVQGGGRVVSMTRVVHSLENVFVDVSKRVHDEVSA